MKYLSFLLITIISATSFGQLGGPICDSLIRSSNLWGYVNQQHDTSFEKIVKITTKCDTTILRDKVSQSKCCDPNYLTYRVEIRCVPDTIWGARDDLKLTPDDIKKLLMFLRGKWTPERRWDNSYYIPATTLLNWTADTIIRTQ